MPSEETQQAALLDIASNIRLARSFASGMDYEAFCANILVFYAVTRCLEIVSEASRRFGDEIENRHPDIPWRSVAAAGNIWINRDQPLHGSRA